MSGRFSAAAFGGLQHEHRSFDPSSHRAHPRGRRLDAGHLTDGSGGSSHQRHGSGLSDADLPLALERGPSLKRKQYCEARSSTFDGKAGEPPPRPASATGIFEAPPADRAREFLLDRPRRLSLAIVRLCGSQLARRICRSRDDTGGRGGADIAVLLGRVAAHEHTDDAHLSAHARRGWGRTLEEVRRNRAADWVFTAEDLAAIHR